MKSINNYKDVLYFNIITLVYLYRDQSFYLPIFSDFWSKLYTLTNYLSYQGNDLTRSFCIVYRVNALRIIKVQKYWKYI